MNSVVQTAIAAGHFYTIEARSGKVIQAAAAGGNDAALRLGTYEHKPEQEWAFLREGDNVYRIRNRANGKLLDLMMAGTANGTWLHLWEDVGGMSQMWTLQPTPTGEARLLSAWASGKCIDTVGMGAGDGAILQIWQETTGGDQLWTIREVEEPAVRHTAKKAAPVATAQPTETAAPVLAPTTAPAEAALAGSETPDETAKKPARKPRTRKSASSTAKSTAKSASAATAKAPRKRAASTRKAKG